MMEKFDIIIVGAGAAGLMAASILSESGKAVCILEARGRCGGRIDTKVIPGFTAIVEAGAEFIHGNVKLTIDLLKKTGIEYHISEGKLWQYKDSMLDTQEDFVEHADELKKQLNELDKDISVAELMDFFPGKKYASLKSSLKRYVEGYSAADINRASSMALKDELESTDQEQYRIENGYGAMIKALEQRCKQNGCIFYLNTVIKKIKWEDNKTEVFSSGGSFFSTKAIITVPPVFLYPSGNEAVITFEPDLPLVAEAARQTGYGGVIKIIIEFDHPFWETGEGRKTPGMLFVFSEEMIPTWWTQFPDKTPVLTGWLAGPPSAAYTGADDEKILQAAFISLSSIYNISIDTLQQYCRASHIHNWNNDTYSKGGYSFKTVTSAAAIKILNKPVGNTLFFAGEAIDENYHATVEAALSSGRNTAGRILKLI